MVTIFKKHPYSENGQQIIKQIAKATLDIHGDQGSCVMGMRLKWRGIAVAHQICQGSLTNEYFFQAVIDAYMEMGFDTDAFSIEYGRMD